MTLLDWVTPVAAVALVLITTVYTWQTWRSVGEMRATRLEAIRPSLRLSPDILGVDFPVARLTNVGIGYAINIRGSLHIRVDAEEQWSYHFKFPVLAPGDFRDFVPRLSDGDQPSARELVSEGRTFAVDLQFADAVGREYHVTEEADWRAVTENLWGARMLRPNETERNVERHLEKIARSMDEVTSPFHGVKVTAEVVRTPRAGRRAGDLDISTTEDSG